MLVSLILPCRNEERHIGACLDSLVATAYPHQHLELLVVDGESDDATREIVARYASAHPWIRVIDNPDRIVPAALNRGLRAARGEVIVRVDAHALYPPEYIPRLVRALDDTGADNVGGRVITLPADPSETAYAIAQALSHPFGVGNAYFRLAGDGPAAPREVDTVPFGCWRRAVFDRIGTFDEELVRNQDDEFNYRLRRAGGRVVLVPDVVAYYYARASRRQLARMLYQYGYFKPLVARKVGAVVTVRQLVPPAFVAVLVSGAVLAPFWPPAAVAWAAALVGYAGATLACAAYTARGLRSMMALAATFPLLHVSYGYGFLRGLWHLATRRRLGKPSAIPLTR
ncbi:MAG TPA: glycosyltransferase family 2 protein [Gemmatimonadaceae bacterium]